jgi:hypothetical protein
MIHAGEYAEDWWRDTVPSSMEPGAGARGASHEVAGVQGGEVDGFAEGKSETDQSALAACDSADHEGVLLRRDEFADDRRARDLARHEQPAGGLCVGEQQAGVLVGPPEVGVRSHP